MIALKTEKNVKCEQKFKVQTNQTKFVKNLKCEQNGMVYVELNAKVVWFTLV